MKKFISSCLIVFLSLTSYSIIGQCNLVVNTKVIDKDNNLADTTNVPVLIAGAINNNLSTPQQGLCGVSIKFKHPFVKELFIELISPSGQKIRLVGGDITSYFTDLVTWDVSFVPDASTPVPDPGFLPKWENDQDWEQLTTYTGQYHPFQGRLENFTTGAVNGTWILRCIDNVDGGEGIIQSVALTFCQQAGVGCTQCRLDPGVISNPDVVACQNSPSLNLTINKTYPSIQPIANSVYSYQNVIFKDNQILRYGTSGDLRSEGAGTYKICGIQYITSDLPMLPTSGQLFDNISLDQRLKTIGLCAAVSDSCMIVTIGKQSPTAKITQYICQGDSYTINGQTFKNQGVYNITIPNGICDSLVELDLKVISIPATITADRDVISCLQNTNTVQINTSLSDVTYSWYTVGGQISGDPSIFAVDAKAPGDYCSIVTRSINGKACVDTLCKTITPDFSYPDLVISHDTLDCTNNQMMNVGLTSTIPLTSASWISREGNAFVMAGNGITVTEPGWYVVDVTATNGCRVKDSTLVAKDIYFDIPTFSAGNLTCVEDSTYITIDIDSTRSYSYNWGSLTSMNTDKPLVLVPDTYSVTVTDTNNGCSGTYTINVAGDITPPIILDIKNDTINCSKPVLNPILTTDTPIDKYKWNLGVSIVNGPNPNITSEGFYNVTITKASNGCETVYPFTIYKDTDIPILAFTVDSITCLKDSVQILTNSNKPIMSYLWMGSGFSFTSTDKDPWVKNSGTYTLNYIANNGCRGIEKVFVPNSIDIPRVFMTIDTFRCGQSDTLTPVVTFVQDPNYTYEWSGPGVFPLDTLQPKIFLPGDYSLKIVNPATGCSQIKRFNVFDNRIYTNVVLDYGVLDCIKDSVQLNITNTDIVSAIFTSPSSNIFNSLSPFVKEVGTYKGMFTNDKNCVSELSFDVLKNEIKPNLSLDYLPFVCGEISKEVTAVSDIAGTLFSWGANTSGVTSGEKVTILKGEQSLTLTGVAPTGCNNTVVVAVNYDTLIPNFSILAVDPLTCKDLTQTLLTNFTDTDGVISWEPSNTVAPSLSVSIPGQYIAVVKKSNNCIGRDTITVLEDKAFPEFAPTSTVINCKDRNSMIKVNVSTPFTQVRWLAGNPEIILPNTVDFVSSFSGVFKFEVENVEGCVKTGEIIVLEDTKEPTVVQKIQESITCKVTSTNIGFITQNGINQVIWNGPSPVFDVKTDSLLAITKGGLYYAAIEGTNFCRKDTFINIIEDKVKPILALSTDTLTCDKGKINITLNVTGSVTVESYQWSGPQMFESSSDHPLVFRPGFYVVNVTATNGCTTKDSIKVIQDIVKPILVVQDTFNLPCDTTPISLMVDANVEILRYKWIFPDGTIDNTANPMTNIPGIYEVQVASNNGCLSEQSKTLVFLNTTPPGFRFVTDTITCSKNQANLIASSDEANISYQWQSLVNPNITGNNAVLNTTIAGAYTLIVSNENKCRDTVIVNVGLDTIKPTILLNSFGKIQCKVADVTIVGDGSSLGDQYVYKWSTTNGNITKLLTDLKINVDKPGLYSLNITNNDNGCTNTRSLDVKQENSGFNQVNIVSMPPSCENIFDGSILFSDLDGEAPYKITINGQNASSNLYFTNLASGLYQFELEDAAGCIQSHSVVVDNAPDLDLSIDNEYVIKYGDSITLAPTFSGGISNNSTITWISRGDTLCKGCPSLTVSPYINTVYEITYGTNSQCSKTTNVLVRVNNDLKNSVPNVFNTNSVGGNNMFYIPQVRGIQRVIDIKIFDKWAEGVYWARDIEPGDASLGWDGTFKGKPCETGVYLVVARLLLDDGKEWTYTGDVTLIK